MVFTFKKEHKGNGMATLGITLAFAGLLASGFAFAADQGAAASVPKSAKASQARTAHASKRADAAVPAAPGPGRMQVEEPKPAAPVATARESKAWQKNHARGLTEAQKQAFRDRKEKMETMIAVIKEKRKAMAAAKPEERAAIARELHSLILEKDPAVTAEATARMGADPAALEEKPSASDAKKGEISDARRKQNEWRQSHKGHGSGDNDDD